MLRAQVGPAGSPKACGFDTQWSSTIDMAAIAYRGMLPRLVGRPGLWFARQPSQEELAYMDGDDLWG